MSEAVLREKIFWGVLALRKGVAGVGVMGVVTRDFRFGAPAGAFVASEPAGSSDLCSLSF